MWFIVCVCVHNIRFVFLHFLELLLFDCLLLLFLLLLFISVSSTRMIHLWGLTVCVVIRFLESSRTSCRLFNDSIKVTATIKTTTKTTTTKNVTDLFRNWYEINIILNTSKAARTKFNFGIIEKKNPVKMNTITFQTMIKKLNWWLKLRLETPNYSNS